jgi:hypothetical protein
MARWLPNDTAALRQIRKRLIARRRYSGRALGEVVESITLTM